MSSAVKEIFIQDHRFPLQMKTYSGSIQSIELRDCDLIIIFFGHYVSLIAGVLASTLFEQLMLTKYSTAFKSQILHRLLDT